ncbi:HAMP domain-containing sensor histidine kinase [Sulfurimonas sp. HSL-1656]|uniref:sensor histidine kinase n=1 Tax=Thiomicrolovo subterrani TaxID=3131934 RepID=UPI0031F9DE81
MAKTVSSATNVRAISFAENRTFRSFVLLYTLMGLAILALLGLLYFRASKAEMLSSHRLSMQLEGESYLPNLIKWMQGERADFPVDPAYDTAFYLGQKHVGGRLPMPPLDFSPGIHENRGMIYLVIPMGSYGLKEGKTVMMTRDDGLWLQLYWRSAAMYGTALFVLLLLTGVGLSRLFLRPMKEAVALLDSFIKDTTHELNTPVTAILTNVERLDTALLDDKQRKKIARIETAARTIGSIYDDLTFLLLRRDVRIEDVPIDLAAFVKERVEYFQTRFDAKGLHLEIEVEATANVVMDRTLAARLIDNLLSNAVKYSDRDTSVLVGISAEGMRLENTGVPIPEEKLSHIFERFARADESRGGFGIGLHLVAQIAARYRIRIAVETEGKRTRFVLTWPR